MSVQGNIYVVPWADKDEWRDVRNKITSDKVEDVMEAYEIMSMWKLKSDRLPAYIECTAGILQVMIQEYLTKPSCFKDYDLRLSYSTAIIRFVNHVHNVSEARYNSLYSSAKIQNIPDWIVTMRHDAAHGQNLPALETFHLAAKVSIEWLLKNYWFHKELYVNTLEPETGLLEHELLTSSANLKLFPIYQKTIKIWEICCDETQCHNETLVSHLSEEKLCYILSFIQFCKTDKSINGVNCERLLKKLNSCCKNSDKCTLKYLKRSISELIKSITFDETSKYTFILSVLQSDFMIDSRQKKWGELICLIQMLKCVGIFLKLLFQLAANDNDVALDLLDCLGSSISILKRQWRMYKDKFKIVDKKKKKALRKKCSHSYISVRFSLRLQKPPAIKLNMMEDLLKNPTARSKKVIYKYLSLVDPPLPEAILKEATTLIDIYCGRETGMNVSSDETEKIYTLEDLKMYLEENIICDENSLAETGSQLWNKSSISLETWSSCPLGLLPNQKTVDLTIPKNAKCNPEDLSGARPIPPLTIDSAEMKNLRQQTQSF